MKNQSQTGLTLPELLIVIAIIAVMTALGVAGYQELTRINRTTSQTNALVAALQLTRGEAIKRNTEVFVCASNSVGTTAPQCDTSTWEKGWIVFADPNRDDLTAVGIFSGAIPNGDDVIVGLGQGLTGGATIQNIGFSQPNFVEYHASGRANSTGSFVFCDSKKDVKHAHAINIGTTGLVTIAEDTDSPADGIVNIPYGATPGNVTCP